MSRILYSITKTDNDRMITEQVTYKLWENAGHKIMEAQLTADQINELFANAGSNLTMEGKVKDAANAVNKAWKNLKGKIYDSGPMTNFASAYDSAAEKLKKATGDDQGAMKYVQKYRDLAEKYPVLQEILYATLIAAVGISGSGLGGAVVLGLFRLVDKALQGKDIRDALWSATKTGVTAYGASKLGDFLFKLDPRFTNPLSTTTAAWDIGNAGRRAAGVTTGVVGAKGLPESTKSNILRGILKTRA